jgi:hypothetical protein
MINSYFFRKYNIKNGQMHDDEITLSLKAYLWNIWNSKPFHNKSHKLENKIIILKL